MGIKDLNVFIRSNVPHAINERELFFFKGKKVAIDTSIFMYKFLYKNDNFLEGFFQQIYKLLINGITPIYVFDGRPSVHKYDVVKQRKNKKEINFKKRQILLEKYYTVLDKDAKLARELWFEINKLKKKVININKFHINKLKEMLDLLRIHYVHPDGEADSYCSKLCKDGIVDMCLSDDMDLLAGGSAILLRNFNSNTVLEYDLKLILKELNITYDQWVDLCILFGCDYTSRIIGINSKNAYKYITIYGSIEGIIKNLKDINTKFHVPNSFDYVSSRKLFKQCEHYGPCSRHDFSKKSLWNTNFYHIKRFVQNNTLLSSRQINNRLIKMNDFRNLKYN